MKKLLHYRHLPLILLMMTNLFIGLWILPDYGESWDEGMLFQYADRSMRAYGALKDPALMPVSFIQGDPLHGDHGPAFVMLVTLLRQAINQLDASIPSVNINHFSYFIIFQFGIVSLYFIALRWMSQYAAFGAVLLFSTQPVLWGHAFINPKDSVFMSLFLASLATGLWMVDRIRASIELPNIPVLRSELAGKLNFHSLLPVFIWLVIFLVVWVEGASLTQILISRAYRDGSATLLGQIFQMVASQKGTISAEQYIKKGLTLFAWFKDLFALAGLMIIIRTLFRLAPNWTKSSARWLAAGLKGIFGALLSIDLWLVSFVLGFSTAVRVVAPLAGVLVVLYVCVNRKWNAMVTIIWYAVLSIIIMLALWPHLWPAPLERFISSIFSSTRYVVDVQTLFAGSLYYSKEIPRSYLPVLFSLQLTETTLLLVLLGVFVLLARKKQLDYGLILLAWFLLPITFFILDRVPLYDNFRHVLFILPPLFLLAGTGLDWLFSKFSAQRYRVLITGFAILPAVIANVSLHPYQYIYYNQLAGGLRGAFRQYQLDYWDISYREAALYLKEAAPPNARIVPLGPYTVLRQYARPDIQFVDPETVTSFQDYDYIVISTRNNQDLDFAQFKTVYSIERDGVPLTVIKKP